jgi:primosomal protein N' (replication factor Y)
MSEEERFETGVEYVNVILDSGSRQLDRSFTYEVPPELAGRVAIGSMVVVPFLSSMQLGFVIEFCERPDLAAIRAVAGLAEETPVFDRDMVSLCKWISSYYLSPLSQALRLVLPPGRKRKICEMIELTQAGNRAMQQGSASERESLVIEALRANGGNLPAAELKTLLGEWTARTLKAMEKRSWLSRNFILAQPKVSELSERVLSLTESGRQAMEDGVLRTKTPARHRLLEALADNGGELPAAEARRARLASGPTIRAAIQSGLVSEVRRERRRRLFEGRSFEREGSYRLNEEQRAALESIRAGLESESAGAWLLHGVTGSGKTEVYLQAIDAALAKERSCLVLVPEIALTPQMVERFKARLGEEVAVLHSGLGLGERYDQWRGIREGRHRVVIGARSALFAPLRDLGLIIIDEEHETTYKEGSPPRYNAGRVALELARLKKALVIYGSATPSLESRYAAARGDYSYLNLPHRIDNRPLPRAESVDMRELAAGGFKGLISPQMATGLAAVYKSGEQAILFLNRRGFARFLQCHGCGHIFQCPNCSVSLCYHAREGYLLCHHCDFKALPPFVCPQCGKRDHRYTGAGTERVESELKAILPGIEAVRMDADTTRRKDSHWDILERFKSGKAQVLLGTQMIAKGLDIPSVTLVGIISADTSLGLPDFRAGERTFQLLTQVSGRAGRGARHGRVIVQSYDPEHYAIRTALQGDEARFYQKELEQRRETFYPPFCRLINLVLTAVDQEDCIRASEWLGRRLRSRFESSRDVLVLGPAPAPLSRLKGRYRYHLTLKCPPLPFLEGLDDCLSSFESFRTAYCKSRRLAKESISLIVDVDPVSML